MLGSWRRSEYVSSLPPSPSPLVISGPNLVSPEARVRGDYPKNWLTNPVLQLGTFGRAKRKVDELQGVIAESRRAGH